MWACTFWPRVRCEQRRNDTIESIMNLLYFVSIHVIAIRAQPTADACSAFSFVVYVSLHKHTVKLVLSTTTAPGCVSHHHYTSTPIIVNHPSYHDLAFIVLKECVEEELEGQRLYAVFAMRLPLAFFLGVSSILSPIVMKLISEWTFQRLFC
jgi:hypothetical protein